MNINIINKLNKLLVTSYIIIGVVTSKIANAALLDNIKNKTIQTGREAGFDVKRDLRESIALMINGLLGFLGILFTVLIIYAGWQWMTAGGNEEQVSKAKKTITNSTIGLLVVIVAYALSVWIFNVIEKSVGTGSPPQTTTP